ncbi:RICIN domain-containing protein [Streptomyces sp. NPDC049040]|uniref:RICIN domain-containing protein n=1 Tax=Streptomyces sp. NPDC049040 TaxID=3365593 RepID=UPI0037238614
MGVHRIRVLGEVRVQHLADPRHGRAPGADLRPGARSLHSRKVTKTAASPARRERPLTSGTVLNSRLGGQSVAIFAHNQQRRVNSDGTIAGVRSGLCLDVTGASTADGALVELWTRNGGADQRWSWHPCGPAPAGMRPAGARPGPSGSVPRAAQVRAHGTKGERGRRERIPGDPPDDPRRPARARPGDGRRDPAAVGSGTAARGTGLHRALPAR